MFRLSNLADYALVLLALVAADEQGDTERPVSTRDLARVSGLPPPTVAKVLKRLVRATLLKSHRGAQGGYVLARSPSGIRVSDVIEAFDGPVALTRCTTRTPRGEEVRCKLMARCPTQAAWAPVNKAINSALADLTLKDIFSAQASPLRDGLAVSK